MRPVLFLTALVALAACDTGVETRKAVVPAAEQGMPPRAIAPLTAAGPAASLTPDGDANLQWSASVVQLDALAKQGTLTAKLFGTAGGDPAMNGLYTHVAFFVSPADGWRVFRIGDFLSYRVLSEAAGRVDLEVEESTHDEATGQIGSRKRRLIVGWAAPTDGSPPTTVTVTPAQ